MRHAANDRQEAFATPAAARLHLQRGSSSQVTWILEDVPGGTSISVGADPGCDWQIRAAGVPPHALSVLLLSGNLFVRSTCEGDVLLDGSPLGDSWIATRDGARLDIGQCQIAIARGATRSAFEGARLATLSYTEAEVADHLAMARQQGLSTATRLGFPAASLPASRPDVRAPVSGSRELARDSRGPVSGTRPLPAEAPEARDEQEAVLNRHSRSFAPSLLGEDQRRSGGAWFYVLVGVATLFAYAGWVLALDRF